MAAKYDTNVRRRKPCEVLIGQDLPLVGVIGIIFDMPLKAMFKCLLHFFLEGDSTLLSEPDKSDFCFHCIAF